ncbi:MAG: hypothetical protein ABL917_02135 [Parcubacteria group bacterium]
MESSPVKTVLKIIVFVLIVGTAIGWFAQGNEFFLYKVFAPAQESVRRQVFEQSKAYNQGMIQELQNMQFEYVKEKDKDAKAALASIILHRAADYNLEDERVPADLRQFINQLKRERTEAR